MLNLILVEAELELVPKSIIKHPSILKMAERRRKKPTELLLDSNFHHSAMKGLNNFERRGRPDLVHHVLLTALDSPLNHENLLRIYIHTLNGYLIRINPKTKIPQSYNRFLSLFEQLFKEKRVPSKNVLLSLERCGMPELLESLNTDYTALLSEKGRKIAPHDLGKKLSQHKRPTIMVGGFTHGSFSKDTEDLTKNKFCIDPRPLKAWTVSTRCVYEYEDAIGLRKDFGES